MTTRTCAALAVAWLAAAPALAQNPPPGQIKGQAPDRGRPTKHDDEQPLLDADAYFLGGPWTFEWDVPESPLGSAGRITGTTTYKSLGGKFYEALTEADGPDGTFTIKETIAYHKDYKAFSRHVVDSRGFSYDQIAHVGADLGGFYNILWESAPFTVKGQTVRLKHTMRLNAPLAYRVGTTIAVDGDEFVNYGNPWWRKQVAGAKD